MSSAPAPSSICVCGHARQAHEHYRRGTDCGICGADRCPSFRGERTTPRSSGARPAPERSRVHRTSA